MNEIPVQWNQPFESCFLDRLNYRRTALAHASHRGDDLVRSLRLVLGTVTGRFTEEPFLRIPLVSKSLPEVDKVLSEPIVRSEMTELIGDFGDHIGNC